MLGDAASFASGYIGGANRIEQRGLAVIHVAHDRDHGRTRHAFAGGTFLTSGRIGDFLGGLFFEGDHVGIRSEEARHLAGQFGVERLVDGGEHAASQQARDQILGANSQLLGQVLDADSFRDGDAARDRLRLVRKRQARRRHEALHRAFFYASRNIALPWPAGRRTRTAARTGRRPRRQLPVQLPADGYRSATGASDAWAGVRLDAVAAGGWSTWTRPLKNWLTRHRTSRNGRAVPPAGAPAALAGGAGPRAPYIPDAVRSAARSFAAAPFAVARTQPVQLAGRPWSERLVVGAGGRRGSLPERGEPRLGSARRCNTAGLGATGAEEATGGTGAADGGGTGAGGAEKVGLGVEVGTTNFGGAAAGRGLGGLESEA